MTCHEWKGRDAEGRKRSVRAVHYGGAWSVSVLGPEDDDWQECQPVPLEILEELRDILWRKYQRRRLPWEQVDQIDRMIEARRREGSGSRSGSGGAPAESPPGNGRPPRRPGSPGS